jgi:hypothetical protein
MNIDVVERIARWVSKQLRMFGLGEGQDEELGWGEVREGSSVNVSGKAGENPSVQKLTNTNSAKKS